MSSFNERRFLIRSLIIIFLIQFASTGAQLTNCFRVSNSALDNERANVICTQANSSFAETSKLALTTLLALLVPAASVASVSRRRKNPEEEHQG